jgi:CubicO group peptidase (beta-lactamase class C family)
MRRLFLLFCLVAVGATGAAPLEPSAVEREVDAFLQPLLDEDLISGSVLIARNGKIELAKGYGPANREYDAPCEADTVYRLASMTKSFTATAIMMLQEREQLSVEDTLDKYIPDYPRGDAIKLHHLLTHTSGVVNYSKLPDHYKAWTMPHTLDEVIARFKDEPLQFEPGERWGYSNSGYVLLTRVIEQVSGTSYEEFLEQNIFEPLGMQHTAMDSHVTVIPKRATGHYNFGDGILQAPYLNIEFTSGAGGMCSTVRDLYAFDRALYTDALVSQAGLTTMFTPVEQDYGYGWFVRDENGHKLIEHIGGINGFLTMLRRYVDDDVTVITLFNYVSTFARDVNRGLAAIALGQEYRPVLIPDGVEVPADRLKGLAGSYRLMDSALEVSFENGKLWVKGDDLDRSEAIPQNENRFYIRQANAVLNFQREEDGRVRRMILQQSEHVIPCEPIGVDEAG